jgi:hypothetical protein
MLNDVATTYCQTVKAGFETFGWSRPTLDCLAKLPALGLFNHLGLALDHLAFPAFRDVRVRSPLFIMGHPRSATTLLHRTLSRHPDAMSFKAWELFFPALTWRRVLGRALERKQKAVVENDTGHAVNWTDVEEEELLFMHLLDTQMATVLLPLGFSGHALSTLGQDGDKAVPVVRFLKGCLQRQSLHTGRRQVVARMNYSILRMTALRAVFPDARFVLVYRHPSHAIASHLSLHKSIFAKQWGPHKVPPSTWNRYVERRYAWSCNIYKRLASELADDAHGDVLGVSFDDITQNLVNTVSRILEFANMGSDSSFQAVVDAKADQQRTYRATHNNSPLSDFGLSETQINTDLEEEIQIITSQLTKGGNLANKRG